MNTLKQFIHSALILIFFTRLNIFKSLIFIKYSKAQLRQDIFALSQLNYKKNGYVRKNTFLSRFDNWYVKL